MNLLKSLTLIATILMMGTSFAQHDSHGGGNGGDDSELGLKKRSLQIGHFLKSTTGSQIFRSLNPDVILETIERTDIDVVIEDVVDKYGTVRTCVNQKELNLITCNSKRIQDLIRNKQDDILTAILFHEILGIMDIELGYQENVSLYPISSKIIPYTQVVLDTPISEAIIRPEYFGKDFRSYGATFINKKTKESIRLICLNDNVEIHRCRNYSVVRKINDLQAPLTTQSISISPELLNRMRLILQAKKLAKADKDMEILLNLKSDLSLVGKTIETSASQFEEIAEATKRFLISTKQTNDFTIDESLLPYLEGCQISVKIDGLENQLYVNGKLLGSYHFQKGAADFKQKLSNLAVYKLCDQK